MYKMECNKQIKCVKFQNRNELVHKPIVYSLFSKIPLANSFYIIIYGR